MEAMKMNQSELYTYTVSPYLRTSVFSSDASDGCVSDGKTIVFSRTDSKAELMAINLRGIE